jgi:hypothetical protein
MIIPVGTDGIVSIHSVIGIPGLIAIGPMILSCLTVLIIFTGPAIHGAREVGMAVDFMVGCMVATIPDFMVADLIGVMVTMVCTNRSTILIQMCTMVQGLMVQLLPVIMAR